MGTSRLLLKGLGVKSTATYIKSAVPEHQTHWKASLEEMPTVWTEEKNKRYCIVSKPSLSLSSDRSPQAEDVAFQTCRSPWQVSPHVSLTPQTSCRKWGWWKSSKQCQNSTTASTASFAERMHRLPHAPLPREWGSSSSKPYSLHNFPTQGKKK